MEFVNKTLTGSSQCESEIKQVLAALFYSDQWGLDFFQTWGIHPRDIFQEVMRNGDFDKCRNFKHENFKGKYCTATIIANSHKNDVSSFGPYDFDDLAADEKHREYQNIGVCVPKSCSKEQLVKFGNRLIQAKGFQWGKIYCFQKAKLERFDWFVIYFLIGLLLATLLSTYYDVKVRQRGKNPSKFLSAFSAYTNFNNLLKLNYSESAINCIDSLKVISAFWIIVGHRKLFSFPVLRGAGYYHKWDRLVREIVDGYNFGVDTFFACTAILATQSLLRSMESGKFGLLKTYLNRYLRFLPTMLFLELIFFSSLPQFLVEGPRFSVLTMIRRKCKTWWWKNFFFYQNYGDAINICLNHTWYLAVDFQLFLMTPFIVYVLWLLGPKIIKYIVMMVALLDWRSYQQLYRNRLSYFPKFYEYTQFRAAQYLVGIIAGFLFFNLRGKRVRLNILIQIVMWGAALTFLALHSRMKLKNLPRKIKHRHMYTATFREIWTVCIAWIIFACHYLKSGGIIRWFLSHVFWQPLSKISLSLYLVHYLYANMTIVNQKMVPRLDSWWQIHIFAGDILIALILALIVYLLVEAPANILVSYVMNMNFDLNLKGRIKSCLRSCVLYLRRRNSRKFMNKS